MSTQSGQTLLPSRSSPPIRRAYCDGVFGQVHYRYAGSGPLIILCHQAGSSSHAYAEAIERLTNAGYMAVAVDTPGAGMSDPASSEPDIGMLSFAIDAVLLHLRAENVYLVGHHTGGNLAASFAARRPGNVRGLVISGPEAGFVYRHYESSLPEAPRADGAHLTNLWALMVAYAPEGLSPALLTRHFSYAVLCRDHAWHQNFATAKFNAGTCYEAVKSPTLVLCGTRDPMYAYVEETRRLRPDFEFVEFPGATSYILDQDCAGWCAAILAFLSRAA